MKTKYITVSGAEFSIQHNGALIHCYHIGSNEFIGSFRSFDRLIVAIKNYLKTIGQ